MDDLQSFNPIAEQQRRNQELWEGALDHTSTPVGQAPGSSSLTAGTATLGGPGSSLNLSQPPGQAVADEPERAVTIYDDSLSLSDGEVQESDGLIYKAICKTGTLALSPGPGQMDQEKPLHLTEEMFNQLVESVEEQAFPYVTVPLSHENSLLENTGYVRKLEVRESNDPNDPPGTKVLVAGVEFTEPEIKQKVERGTIPDTSIGVRFNYRNKRTGKTYPAALEHVALTHQPWVDGLTPFGQSANLSQEPGVFDQETSNPDWDGVYVPVHKPRAERPSKRRKRSRRRVHLGARKPKRNSEIQNILSSGKDVAGMDSTLLASITREKMPPIKKTSKTTAEQLLASQQAQIDKVQSENAALRQQLELAQAQQESTIQTLFLAQVDKRARELQDDGIPPAVVQRYREIRLALGHEADSTDENSLNLSIANPEGEIEERELSLSQVIDYLVEAVPRIGSGNLSEVMGEIEKLQMSQKPSDEKSPEERAKEIYDKTKERIEGGAA